MNSSRENIVQIAEEITSSSGFFLIDIVIRGTERNRVIEVFVDSEKNITAKDCAEISRKINEVFEERELIKAAYRLDVSSPGIDRPLLYLKQYPKHINRKFEITYSYGDEKKKLKGTLKKIEGEYLTFLKNKEQIINFKDIINAKVLVNFS
jgi:ribosome maturation factor RimP